jgi:hypothetical protein
MESYNSKSFQYEDKNLIDKYLHPNENIFDIITNSNKYQTNSLQSEFFNYKTNRHKKCLPKPEAYLIRMEFDEFDLSGSGEILSRRVFENPKGFLERENKKLNELKEEIEIYNKNNPKKQLILHNNIPESEILKIFQSYNFDFTQTIKALCEYFEFREAYFPIKITDKTIEILSQTGYLYVHGRDRFNRPILICRAESYMLNINKYNYEEWLNAIIYFSEYVINYLLIPGQIESWNIIADMNNISLMSIPSDFGKFLKFLQTFYRCRLNKCFVYGMNKFLDFLWKIIKNFLHANVDKKVNFINDSNIEKVFELILPEQLEIKYGGKAINLFNSVKGKQAKYYLNVEYIFPPNFPDAPNQTKDDLEKLSSEEEYYSLYINNMINKISPYIDYKKLEEKYKMEKTFTGKLI